MTPETFNQQFGHLRPILMGEAMRLSGDLALSEDLVQETLLRLWLRREHLAGHPNVEGLACTTLRHLWTDYWRREQKRRHIRAELAADVPTVELPEDTELISLLVERLPPLQQQVFRLSVMEGYGHEEIMAITGCSAESLRQNLSRARRRLRLQYLKMAVVGLTAAVSVALLVTFVVRWPEQGGADYAVIDGRRTTDAQAIREEAEEALRLVSSTEEENFEALDMLSL